MATNAPTGGYFQPDTLEADFAYWAKMPLWTESEATNLLLGLNPKFSFIKRSRVYGAAQTRSEEYAGLLHLAEMAREHDNIPYPHTPSRWLDWAKNCDLPIPPALEKEISLRNSADASTPGAVRARETSAFLTSAGLTYLDHQPQADAKQKTGIGTRERESMLTLIIAMAVQGYRYDPTAQRSERIKEIVGDIEKCGLSLSDDTVRSYLREAADLLPPKENRDR
jgi:hypothetical protein